MTQSIVGLCSTTHCQRVIKSLAVTALVIGVLAVFAGIFLLVQNHKFPFLWKTNPFTDVSASCLIGGGLVVGSLGIISLFNKKKTTTSKETPSINNAPPMKKADEKSEENWVHKYYNETLIVGYLPNEQTIDIKNQVALVEEIKTSVHTVFLFKRFDSRLEPHGALLKELHDIRVLSHCKNIIFVFYSIKGRNLDYSEFKDEILKAGHYFIDLRIDMKIDAKFNDRINEALRGWFKLSVQNSDKLQETLDNTPTDAFSS